MAEPNATVWCQRCGTMKPVRVKPSHVYTTCGDPRCRSHSPRVDLTGRRFGRLTAIGLADRPVSARNVVYWSARCDCGEVTQVTRNSLLSGNTRSCGCLKRERLAAGTSRTHGEASSVDRSRRTKRWMLWNSAKIRAKRLGLPFSIGLTDVVIPETCPALGIPLTLDHKRPHDDSPSIDRIIPELGYVPGNIAVISARANRIKNDARPAEIEAVLRWLTERMAPDEK